MMSRKKKIHHNIVGWFANKYLINKYFFFFIENLCIMKVYISLDHLAVPFEIEKHILCVF